MIKLKAQNLNLYYGNFQALINVNVEIKKNKITAFIGSSGCGKSTLLRCFNRMNDLVDGVKIEGNVFVDDKNIYDGSTDLIDLRRRVGMVFQRPNPFPLSIYENVVFGPRVHGIKNKTELEKIAQESLESVLLWKELKDKLNKSALLLTGEQQQRLCIARLLAVNAQVMLMDEPCSALDPIATNRIEELIQILRKDITVVIVTHNMQQAARVSDDTGFMLLGEMVEFDETAKIFTMPKDKRTEDYITGRFG